MENRSHALLAGIFTVVLLAAAAAVAFWIGRDRGSVVVYELVTDTPVSGLSRQSAVRLQGVPVGKVQSVGFDADKPGSVRILIGVSPDTPITTATWAELGTRGLTGTSVVDLRDDGSSTQTLVTHDDDPARIPVKSGLLQQLEQRGTAVLDTLEKVSRQVDRLMSDQNVDTLQGSIDNLAGLTASLRDSAQALAPVIQKTGPLVDSLQQATQQARATARDVGDLSRTARQLVAGLQAPGGPIDSATRSMAELSWAASRLGAETLPRFGDMAGDVGRAARGLTRTLQNVNDRPQSLLFGPAPAVPGPGEAGFQGFGRTP